MKFLLLDDHPMIRSGLASLLEKDGHEVLYQADCLAAARSYMHGAWDLAIFDLNLPDGDGLDLVRDFRTQGNNKPIIIFSMEAEEPSVHRALTAGANGFLHKGDSPEELYAAIAKVSAGKRYMSPNSMERIAESVFTGAPPNKEATLSPKEADVLRLIGKGLSTKEIAERFDCSTNTVATFRHRIVKKLELTSSVELIRYALKHR